MNLRILRVAAGVLACSAPVACNMLLGNDEHYAPDASGTAIDATSDAHAGTLSDAFAAEPDGPMEDGGPPPADSGAASDTGPEPPGDGAAPDTGLAQTGAAGATCSSNGECASGHCSDGVCCNTACTESCNQCNLTGYVGTCTPVPASAAPLASHPTCPSTDASTCGGNGLCDGTGNCQNWPNGTPCSASTCDPSTNKVASASTCSGTGSCPAAPAVTCAPFKCSGAACATTCASNGDCVSQPCVNGSCGTVANGVQCTSAAQCMSGNCVDGYCCNSACGSSCQACDVAGAQGTCTTVGSGQPHGARAACAGSGTCQGSCNGASTACTYPTVTCAAPSCAGGVALAAATCDGNGACQKQTTSSCNGFACNGTGCYASCTSGSMCGSATPYCVSGQCVATQPLGSSCTSASQCSSNYCVNDVCCSTPACSSPGTCQTTGTCAAGTGACTYQTASNGATCGTNETCENGACNCATGYTSCSSGCTNVKADPQNCGGCGTVCASVTVSSPPNDNSVTCAASQCVATLGITQGSGTYIFPDGTLPAEFAFPVSVPNKFTVEAIVLYVNSGSFDVALYADGGGMPGSELSGWVAVNGTGAVSTSITPQTLSPGTYWLALATPATTSGSNSIASIGPSGGYFAAGGLSLPTTWPTGETESSGSLWVEYMTGTE